MYTPTWQPFDLGAFDASLEGEVIQLLRNPTRSFRQTFVLARGDDFPAAVAFICQIEPGQVEPVFGQYDATLFTWLFVPYMQDGLVVLPHVYRVWDEATKERIKKLGAPSPDQEAAP